MQVVEKAIINRNNMYYLYVEKLLGNFSNIQYRVYYNLKDWEHFSIDDFYSTYGDDEQITLYEFTSDAETDILTTNEYQDSYCSLISDLEILNKNLKSGNKRNPSLWGYKATFLTTMDNYNNAILNKKYNVNDEEHDYEKDIKRLSDEDLEDILLRIREYDKAA